MHRTGRFSKRYPGVLPTDRFSLDDPVLAASVDRIVYLCRKGIINSNQAYWGLNDLLCHGNFAMTEPERFELDRTIQGLLHGTPTTRYRSESTIVAARVPRRVVERIDDFASAYQLTRSQCLGLALDLVFGQEWQLETEPWKHRSARYGRETLPALLNQLEHGSMTRATSTRWRGRSRSAATGLRTS